MNKIKCQICGREFSNKKHLVLHDITEKEYYDAYIKQPKEGLCAYCGKESIFISMWKGYRNTCGYSCASHLREQNRSEENIQLANEKRKQTYINHYGKEHCMQSDECKQKQINTNIERYGTPNVWNTDSPFRSKLEQTMIEKYGGVGWGSNKNFNLEKMVENIVKSRINNISNAELNYNATTQSHLVDIYGQSFLSMLTDDMIIYDDKTRSKLIKNEYIPEIEKYTHRSRAILTKSEVYIIQNLKKIYLGEIINNTRKIIKPKELDIWIPDLKIAVEHNGLFIHSIESGKPKDYHLMKSLLCREKNIRLIHIYEFEDLDQQIKLLQDLILGQDNYPKEDFNKNNLIDIIPEPEIIYQSDRYTIYGAGPLIK